MLPFGPAPEPPRNGSGTDTSGLSSEINEFYELIASELLPELQKLDADTVGIRHWLVIEDNEGTAISEIDEEIESSQVLRSHAEKGSNAAYVTYTPGPPSEHVLAYVLLANRANSDLQEAT